MKSIAICWLSPYANRKKANPIWRAKKRYAPYIPNIKANEKFININMNIAEHTLSHEETNSCDASSGAKVMAEIPSVGGSNSSNSVDI